MTDLYPEERSRSAAARSWAASTRFGRRDLRCGLPGRSCEIAPVLTGSWVGGVVGGVVVIEGALPLLRDRSQDAQV
jgi:hypothetical protein